MTGNGRGTLGGVMDDIEVGGLRVEAGVLSRVVSWAEERPDVRWCVLTSSRAGDRSLLDDFSDFDIVVGVRGDPVEFVDQDRSWIEDAYGTPMVALRSRSQLAFEGPTAEMQLVLYADGTKVDFAVVPTTSMEAYVSDGSLPSAWDLGWRALVDKDKVTVELPAPSFTAHIPRRPNQGEFHSVIEEFWWESTYVAKNLWRGDIVQAKYNLDKVMIVDCLRTVLEWRIEIDHQWNLRPGQLGRHLRARLPADVHDRLMQCFAGGSIEDNWRALWRCCGLMRDIATEVASSLNLSYPTDLDEQVTTYLRDVYGRDDGIDDGSRALDAEVPLPVTALDPVQQLVEGSRELLADSLVGVILHGSLTMGDFDAERSDIDLLVVVSDPVNPTVRAGLKNLVTRAAGEHRIRLDYRVVTADVARQPTLSPMVDLYVGVHSEDPSRVEFIDSEPESDLVIEFSICREHGRSLVGPKPSDLIGTVQPDWVLSVGDAYLERWQRIGYDPPNADLTVLTACRLWHFAATGSHTTKLHAAEWVAARADSAPTQAARTALARREGRSAHEFNPTDTVALLEVVRAVIARQARQQT